MTAINYKERKCLKVLAEHYGLDSNYLYFIHIMDVTKLTRGEVRRAVRSLARKGLAEYRRGLWSDDGPAGAGYCCTKEGFKHDAQQD